MPAYVSLPSVALPEHRVSTEEIVVDLERAGAGRRDLAAAVRIVWALGVDTRYVSRSLARLGEAEEIADRNRWTVEAVYRLGEEAARRALKAARLEAGEVGALVAVHSSGIAMPGLGVHLSRALGLRADVLHVPVTQVGCAGGAWGLALAADLVAARPGRPSASNSTPSAPTNTRSPPPSCPPASRSSSRPVPPTASSPS
ncbi:hypothetical protein ACWCQJ_20855 [Streptomyces olivaceus]